MPGNIEFEFRFGGPRKAPDLSPDEDRPFRLLILADLGGRASRGGGVNGGPLAERKPLRIDVDNFDAVFRRLEPALELPAAGDDGETLPVEFGELDDFHPDALFDRLAPFAALRESRARLMDPATFAEAAAELKRDAAPAKAPGADEPKDEKEGDTLERLLGRRPETPAGAREDEMARRAGIDALIHRIVAPHVVPDTRDEQQQLLSAIDQAVTDGMRAVLHAPAFQALEASWRSVHGLVTGLETGEELQIHVLDVTRDELAADVAAAGQDLEQTDLHGLLIDRGISLPGAHPWSALVGDFSFGEAEEDLRLLAALGAIASRCGGPFLAAASPSLLGCRDVATIADTAAWNRPDDDEPSGWEALRASPFARWIGLALPRTLLRLPYGGRGEQTDRFAFEELGSGSEHDSYLWGNPAYGCALLLGLAFQESGWSLEPGDLLDLEDLPGHVVERDGERALQPCAEIWLGERAATAILARGLMPLMSRRDRNAARLARFQSVAEPTAPLAGPWS